jgi:hypothetical protein
MPDLFVERAGIDRRELVQSPPLAIMSDQVGRLKRMLPPAVDLLAKVGR